MAGADSYSQSELSATRHLQTKIGTRRPDTMVPVQMKRLDLENLSSQLTGLRADHHPPLGVDAGILTRIEQGIGGPMGETDDAGESDNDGESTTNTSDFQTAYDEV